MVCRFCICFSSNDVIHVECPDVGDPLTAEELEEKERLLEEVNIHGH